MGAIPTKHIDGDATVGRNVSAGGNANIQGNVRVGHDLKVEGWLEARNIKGPEKGLFKSAQALREAYPTPHDGWWALVGDTLPAQIYLADKGAWVAQVNEDGTPKTAGTFVGDLTQYTEELAKLLDDILSNSTAIQANTLEIEKLRDTINMLVDGNATEAIDSLNEVLQFLDGLKDSETLKGKLVEINNIVTALRQDIASKDSETSAAIASVRAELDESVENIQQQLDGIGVYPIARVSFHATENLSSLAVGDVIYCVEDGCFYTVALHDGNTGVIVSGKPYNTSSGKADTSHLYRCDGRLYGFDDTGAFAPLPTKTEIDSAIETAKTDMTESTVAEVRRELLGGLQVRHMSEAEYEALAEAGELKDDTIYMTYEDDTEQ